MIKHFRQHCEQTLSFGLSVCPDGHRNEEKKYFFIRLSENIWEIKLLQRFWWQFGENYQKNYGAKLSFFYNDGAKLSWCQIVRFYYVSAKLIVFYLGPKLSVCLLGAKLSVCLLGAKLSVFTILVPNCPGAKLSGAKLSYHRCIYIFIYDTGMPSLQVSKDLQQAVNTEGIKSCERFCQCRWLCAPEEAPSWTLGDEKSLVS